MDTLDADDHTRLATCAGLGDMCSLHMLLERGARVSQRDAHGKTALCHLTRACAARCCPCFALVCGHAHAKQLLLEAADQVAVAYVGGRHS